MDIRCFFSSFFDFRIWYFEKYYFSVYFIFVPFCICVQIVLCKLRVNKNIYMVLSCLNRERLEGKWTKIGRKRISKCRFCLTKKKLLRKQFNAAKAQALYIRKYGKKVFLKLQERLHKKYEFSKTQEILGQDLWEEFRILEEN